MIGDSWYESEKKVAKRSVGQSESDVYAPDVWWSSTHWLSRRIIGCLFVCLFGK